MSRCVIFAGGIIDNDLSFIDTDKIKDSYVICADSGFLYAQKLEVKPDLIIGDFDSLGHIPPKSAVYPTNKDDTDLLLAVKDALNKGYKDIDIYGAFGGRFDHMIGNVQVLAYISEHNGVGRLISANDITTILSPGLYEFDYKEGYSLSLLAYSDRVDSFTISGTEYTADSISLTNAFPLGVSNKIINKKAIITFKTGKLLAIQSKIY